MSAALASTRELVRSRSIQGAGEGGEQQTGERSIDQRMGWQQDGEHGGERGRAQRTGGD